MASQCSAISQSLLTPILKDPPINSGWSLIYYDVVYMYCLFPDTYWKLIVLSTKL